MLLTDEQDVQIFLDGMMKDIIEKELCVNPDGQTYDCCDCTVCRLDFMDRVRKDLMGIEEFKPLSK